MSASHPVNRFKSERTILMDVIFTCCYQQLLLFYLHQLGRINSIGKIENLHIIYVIVLAELVKYFLFGNERIKLSKAKHSIAKEVVKTLAVLIASVILFYITAVLFGAPLWSEWNETFMFSLLMTSVSVFPLCLSLGPDNTVALLTSLNKCMQPSKVTDRLWFNFKMTLVGAWLGAVVIPLDWDRPWQVWPVPCCVGAMLACILANLCSLLNCVRFTPVKQHKSNKLI